MKKLILFSALTSLLVLAGCGGGSSTVTPATPDDDQPHVGTWTMDTMTMTIPGSPFGDREHYVEGKTVVFNGDGTYAEDYGTETVNNTKYENWFTASTGLTGADVEGAAGLPIGTITGATGVECAHAGVVNGTWGLADDVMTFTYVDVTTPVTSACGPAGALAEGSAWRSMSLHSAMQATGGPGASPFAVTFPSENNMVLTNSNFMFSFVR
jgi:hypothetical protein